MEHLSYQDSIQHTRKGEPNEHSSQSMVDQWMFWHSGHICERVLCSGSKRKTERESEKQRKDDVRKDSWEQKIQKLIFISGHMRVECPISVMLLGCHWLPWAYDLLIRRSPEIWSFTRWPRDGITTPQAGFWLPNRTAIAGSNNVGKIGAVIAYQWTSGKASEIYLSL